MSSDQLAERKAWFRYFPEGTIEFTVITRVLAVLLGAALIVVSRTDLPRVLVGIVFTLLIDYALVVWWALELAADVAQISPGASEGAVLGRNRIALLAVIVAPMAVAALLIAPWPAMFLGGPAKTRLMPVMLVALLILYLLLLPWGYRALVRAGLGQGLWGWLMLVPVAHWAATHRVLRRLGQLVDRAGASCGIAAGEAGPRAAVVLADLALTAGVCFGAVWAGLAVRNGVLAGALPRMVQLITLGSFALFAVADVAALEGMQRRFVALLRRI